MESLIHFIHRLDLDFLLNVIILHECRSIEDECALDGPTRFLPGLLFVVDLESYHQLSHFVDIHSNMPLFSNSF